MQTIPINHSSQSTIKASSCSQFNHQSIIISASPVRPLGLSDCQNTCNQQSQQFKQSILTIHLGLPKPSPWQTSANSSHLLNTPTAHSFGHHHLAAAILIAQNNHRLLNNGSLIQTHVGHHLHSRRPPSRASTSVHPAGDSITPNTHLGPKPALPTPVLSSQQQPESSLHTKKKLLIQPPAMARAFLLCTATAKRRGE